MVTLFWGNQDEFELVCECRKSEVHTKIMHFLGGKDPDTKIYYIREWTDHGVTHYDYGSWSKFFYSVPFGISFP